MLQLLQTKPFDSVRMWLFITIVSHVPFTPELSECVHSLISTSMSSFREQWSSPILKILLFLPERIPNMYVCAIKINK